MRTLARLAAPSWTALILALVLTACAGPADDGNEDGVVNPPLCSKVGAFGNGQVCSSDDSTLAACGGSEDRMCASGWLCFDSADVAFCGCIDDADCQSRSDYINKARALKKIAPMAAKCVYGRCAEAP